METFTAAMVGRKFGVMSRRVSDLFYQGKLDSSKCPVVSGRRLIPKGYLPEVKKALEEAGFVKREKTGAGR